MGLSFLIYEMRVIMIAPTQRLMVRMNEIMYVKYLEKLLRLAQGKTLD